MPGYSESYPWPQLTAQQQVQHMRENGITFNGLSECDACDFLRYSNFFFKVKAFDKCFDKWLDTDERAGKYINLDFSYLVELSKLDFYLREVALSLSLDLEHYLKVSLNRSMMEDECDAHQLAIGFLAFTRSNSVNDIAKHLDLSKLDGEVSTSQEILAKTAQTLSSLSSVKEIDDGAAEIISNVSYVADILRGALGGRDLQHIEHSISTLGDSSYSRDLARKFGTPENVAVWHLMELMSFGDTIALYKYYFLDYRVEGPTQEAKDIKQLLFPAKALRNAAAHNSCLLNTARKRLSKPVGGIAKAIMEDYGIPKELATSTKRIPIVHDFSALVICHDRVVSSVGVKKRRAIALRDSAERYMKHIDYFNKQPEVKNMLLVIAQMCDCVAGKYEREPSR